MKNRKLVHNIFLKRFFTKGRISPRLIVFACGVLILPVLFMACEVSNKPGIIYDTSSNITTTDKPVITGITPAPKAIAGIREIKILGKNLGIKNGTDTNWIVIGGANAIIKDIRDSVVTIYRPKLSNDRYDKTISVSVTDTKTVAVSSSMDYYVETPGAVVGDYTGITALLAVDFDKQENLYTTAAKNVYKTDFAGVTQTVALNPINLASSDYSSITAMSFGPGAYGRNLFIAVGKNYIARIYVRDTLVGKTNVPVKLTVPAAVSQLDFDEKGNMYVGGNGNLYLADTSVGSGSAPTFTPISGYEGVNIIKIRVVKESGNEYLYVADSMNVWKSQLGGTSLVKGTPLVALSTHSELSGCVIRSFELDENGSVFLCLRHHPKYSLFIRENDGSVTPFYSDPNILPNTVEKLTWGYNSKNLYLISSSFQSSPGTYASGRIYRLTLDRKGAPYHGREFIK